MTQRPEVARFNMTQRLKAARFMAQRGKAAQIKHYRRFHGYDYSRGASIFVTFAVKGRLPLFGRVEGIRSFCRQQAKPPWRPFCLKTEDLAGAFGRHHLL